MDELFLTDDEVVAVALESGGRWPRRLPTVDVTRDRPLREAAWRGQRSLAVRRLVGVDSAPDAVLECVRRDVVGAEAMLGLRIGGAGTTRPPSSFEVNAFVCSPGCGGSSDLVVETVSDHGVHGFERLPHHAVVTRMAGLAGQALARGVADRSGAARLWIGVVADGRRPSLCVGAGRAEVVDVDGDRVVAGSSRPAGDLRVEVARLAAGLHRPEGLVTARS